MEKVSEITISYRPSFKERSQPRINGSDDAYQVLRPHFNRDTLAIQEQFAVCYLSRNNQVKGVYAGFAGGISGTVVDVRIILAIALKTGSSAIILAHNHPSGNKEPSLADQCLTQKIKTACDTMDLTLLDHLIITSENTYYSFADEGKL